ncbi:ligase-associated DNA damage response endonuclease PdeM [Kaistia geumhonensis]|uniref:DNA ligase-associated metallophosphoesterase n=1 Tax=Kaistia geumhonensis TaxID=410839 RepID=A0ABU0M5X5_9HYPH|nr:ligase-associated DNA damage response endonuclease PdeM [Kaistia geumhonensis]MCX5478414.1 ligase-associated DNA damage response endonuclease PdeM [Kaistia geumhonensis]MDQ0516368.1 DNA ligase-associated metallophosphoesterase [Kaistia geumhonensis]
MIADVAVALTVEGALHIAEEATLVVADLHLEKGSAFAARGQMLPPYDTVATLRRLAALVGRLAPRRVVALGDSFHDRRAAERLGEADRALLGQLVAGCEWIWIAGNHDPLPPAALGGHAERELVVGSLTFRHEPRAGRAPGEVAGHLHPSARVVGRGGSVRRRCFIANRERLVMPAFGALAGGLDVLDDAFRPLFHGAPFHAFMLGEAVHKVAGHRLAGEARGGYLQVARRVVRRPAAR